MIKENINEEFKLKNIKKTKNSFIEEINHNELISKKRKKVCMDLSLIKHLLI